MCKKKQLRRRRFSTKQKAKTRLPDGEDLQEVEQIWRKPGKFINWWVLYFDGLLLGDGKTLSGTT